MTQIELKPGQLPTREDYVIVAQALADLHKPIVSALNRNKCVQAWLGYADVLFLGLGKQVLSPVQKGEKHSMPPFEIATHYADWSIYERIGSEYIRLATNQDSTDVLAELIQKLIGQRVIDWQYTSMFDLGIRFENQLYLEIVPWHDPEYFGKEAWSIREPNGEYIEALCIDRDTPREFNLPHIYSK